jgi:heme/copper-type cytochrome/quinol oxidase subunit 2
MARKTIWKEVLAALVVLLILVGLPSLLWYWKASVVPARYPPGTKIFTLTALADGGIWTQEEVVGHNYWWSDPARAPDLPLNQGDHVVVRLRSVDLLHSFAIPILRLGPVDVPGGHTVEVEFDASRAGALTFLCWQVCSPEHPKLRGRFVVEASEGEDEEW